MDFNEYQAEALKTAQYPDVGKNLVYPAMGIASEGGEYCDKVKKMWRNLGVMHRFTLTPKERIEFAKELGDVLWYLAASAEELDFYLDEIASFNINKLRDRRNRGVIKSEGDNR